MTPEAGDALTRVISAKMAEVLQLVREGGIKAAVLTETHLNAAQSAKAVEVD